MSRIHDTTEVRNACTRRGYIPHRIDKKGSTFTVYVNNPERITQDTLARQFKDSNYKVLGHGKSENDGYFFRLLVKCCEPQQPEGE